MTSSIKSEPREFLSGKLAQVDPAKIENELRALWKQATNEDSGLAGDITRAVSFTLVLFSHDQRNEEQMVGILEDIMEYHPCRAILTYYQPNLPHALDAYVNARCHLLGDKRHVCSEQITIVCNGGKPEELASVVSPLVLADLPVVLWWRSSNLSDPVLQQLNKCTSKVIFDSGYQPFDLSMIQQAGQLLHEHHDCLWLADLNWRRLNGWRRSLAEAFDGFPMEPEYLQTISKVHIEVRGDGKNKGPSANAVLLTGWLASRLGWRDEFIRNVSFAVGDKDTAALPGGICGVTITFEDGRELKVELQHNDGSYLITACEESKGVCESTRVAQYLKEGVLVGQELESMVRDHIFEQSLLKAGEITRIIK